MTIFKIRNVILLVDFKFIITLFICHASHVYVCTYTIYYVLASYTVYVYMYVHVHVRICYTITFLKLTTTTCNNVTTFSHTSHYETSRDMADVDEDRVSSVRTGHTEDQMESALSCKDTSKKLESSIFNHISLGQWEAARASLFFLANDPESRENAKELLKILVLEAANYW